MYLILPHSICSPFIRLIWQKPVLRIRNFLVLIRIRGSVPLTNGSGSEYCYFRQ
jgi:hypothetical protein